MHFCSSTVNVHTERMSFNEEPKAHKSFPLQHPAHFWYVDWMKSQHLTQFQMDTKKETCQVLDATSSVCIDMLVKARGCEASGIALEFK